MQQEQKVTNPRPKKLPVPGPVGRKPVRNSTSLYSPSNQSLSRPSGPAGDVQSTESPVPKVPEEPSLALVYEDINEIFRKNDSRCPNDSTPTYENVPNNLPSHTESTADVDSDDRTYVNQEHLRLAAKELANISKCKKSSEISETCELPPDGTYVKVRSQVSVKSDISEDRTTDAKEEINFVENDESNETDQCYETIGNMDLLLKNSKPIPSEPNPSEREPEAATSLQGRRPSETQQEDSEIKLPMAKQTSKEKRKIKDTISGLKNSLMKEFRSVAHRNPSGTADSGASTSGTTTKWTSVSQIPTNVDQFTIDQVSQCLRLLNLGRYVAAFKERKMNGTILAKASEKMLMEHFQMDALEAQQLVMFAQQGWRPE